MKINSIKNELKKNYLLRLCFLIIFLFSSYQAQSITGQNVTLSSSKLFLKSAFAEIERQTQMTVDYNQEVVDVNKTVSVAETNGSLSKVMTSILAGTEYTYDINGNHIIISVGEKNVQQSNQTGNTITGTVLDAMGESIIGASVVEKGTTNGSISDLDGKFSLTVANDATIVVSYIGYTTREIKVGNQRNITIELEENITMINEVIVIGYGTQKRSEVTAAVASLSKEDFITTAAPSSVLELAQGKIAGVTITTANGTDPRGETDIQIRGVSSITGGTRPLIVIDGVPGGDLSMVQSEDVESINVLKDASAAAIYGSRGANGVVLITTKKAQAREQKPQYDYSSYVAHSYIYRSPKVLSAEQYRDYMASDGYNTDAMVDYGGNTDWLGSLIDNNNFSHNHNLSVSAGNGRSGYRASVYYREVNPIAKQSEQSNWGGRLSVTHWGLNDKLEAQMNLSANFRERNNVGGNAFVGGSRASNAAFEQAAQRNPTMNPQDESGNWIDDQGFGSFNPLAAYATTEDISSRTSLLASGKATLHISEALRASVMASWQQYDDLQNMYLDRDNKTSVDTYGGGGRALKSQSKYITKTIESTVEYAKTFNNIHAFNAIVGHSYQYMVDEGFNAWNTGFQTDIFKNNNLGSGTGISNGTSFANMESNKVDSKLIAFFGRINYVLMDKYQLSAILRHEGSSRFGTNNRWGNFPAVSAGWVINKENFMKDLTWIDELKLRAGFGITGNQDIPDYRYMITLSPYSSYPVYDSSWESAYRPTRNPNPDLKWEKKEELNVGIDFSFLSYRLNGSIDVYNRNTKDLLYNYTTQIPPFVLPEIYTNVGTMSNKGVEIAVSAIPVQTKEFEWGVNTTLTYQQNELTSFSNDLYKGTYIEEYQFTGVGYLGYAFRIQEGQPLGSFYGRRFAEINEKGEWMFYNKDNEIVPDGEITDEDKTWIGNGTPKYYLSLGNTFKYKNFDLSIFLRGKFGFQILNTKDMYFGTLSTLPNNVLESAITKHSALQVPTQFSDYYLENGNFVKLDNITLGYNIPLKSQKWVRNLRIYASASNLATFTGYSGTTPEVRDAGLTPGVEERSFYPTASTLMFGINVGF